MDGKGDRLQVALEVEPGFLDELLVLGVVRDRREWLSGIGFSHPTVVPIEKAVCAGKKPRGFGRSVLAELDGKHQRRGYRDDR
jgi:hypothetical protein